MKKKYQSEVTYYTIFDQSPISTQIFSPEGKTIRVNKAWEKLWGVKLSQMKHFNILHDKQLVHTQAGSYIREGFTGKAVKVPPHSYVPRKTVKASTAPKRWIQDYIYPIKDDTGKIIEVVIQHEDITEQKEAEERLKISEARFRKILEHSTDAITLVDKQGKRIYATPSRHNILGYDTQDDYGESVFDGIFPDDKEKVLASFQEIAKHPGSSQTMIFRIKHQKGHWIWIEATGTNLLAIPHIEAIVINYRDVTERVRLQQQKDDFLGIASHELKTPVTSLKAFGQVLQNRFAKAGDEKSAVMLGKMDAQINKLTSLIADLLDISKIEGGRLEFHNDYFSFDELVSEIIEEVQRTTTKHTLLQKGTTGKTIWGDRDRIGQVLTNYLTNAIKYSPHTEKIIIAVSAHTKELQARVQDFGVGIPQENIPHLFERFYRVKGKTRDTIPGMGLGLYISGEIIKRQGGRVWVESKEGEGSSFYFTLPVTGGSKKQQKNTLVLAEIHHE